MNNFSILPRNFYQRDTVQVAKYLIGKKLIRKFDGQYLVGIISQTEAYTSNDPASHSYKGKTDRNKPMFGPVGHAYVYISYGIHFCFNIVSRDNNHKAGGVLIRAVIPLDGINIMQQNRQTKLENLTNGPGKLTQAFKLTKLHNGLDLTNQLSNLFVAEGNKIIQEKNILKTPRIGISVAKEKLWRFLLSNQAEYQTK